MASIFLNIWISVCLWVLRPPCHYNVLFLSTFTQLQVNKVLNYRNASSAFQLRVLHKSLSVFYWLMASSSTSYIVKQRLLTLLVHCVNSTTYVIWGFCVYFHLQFNRTGHGSVCSQAIMLVTDGATEMYDNVFERHNWPERKVSLSLSPFCSTWYLIPNITYVLFMNFLLALHFSFTL